MILGISGNIASGKSEAMKILKKHGFYCIFSDKIVRNIYLKNKKGQKRVVKYFGKEFLTKNGSVNRKKLGNFVFNNRNKLALLNKVIHPCIISGIKQILKDLIIKQKKNIAIEGVYFDKKILGKFVEKIIWIERDIHKIFKTLIIKRKIKKNIALTLLNIIKKPKKIDFIIENNGTLKHLEKELLKII